MRGIGLACALFLLGLSCTGCSPEVTLYAQSVPAVKHATWTPNAAADNVVSYTVSLDGGAPVTVPLSACTATLCTAAITIPTFGTHAVSVTAQNDALSTDPTSLQSSPPATVTFSLNQQAAKVSNATVGQ